MNNTGFAITFVANQNPNEVFNVTIMFVGGGQKI